MITKSVKILRPKIQHAGRRFYRDDVATLPAAIADALVAGGKAAAPATAKKRTTRPKKKATRPKKKATRP